MKTVRVRRDLMVTLGAEPDQDELLGAGHGGLRQGCAERGEAKQGPRQGRQGRGVR